MIAEGKTQREVAEYFGFKDKYVVKRLLNRQREKRRKLEAGIVPRPKGRPRKDAAQEMWPRSRRMRLRVTDGKQAAAGFSAVRRKEVRPRVKNQNPQTECIYRHKPATFSEANEMIDRYIYFYNHERIQIKTGEAPLTQRLSD